MKKLPNLKCAVLIGWGVAALLILTVMTSEMKSLQEPLATAIAPELSSLRRKARQLDALVSSSPVGYTTSADMDKMFLGNGSSVRSVGKTVPQDVPPVELPELGGVVAVQTDDGMLRYRALLSGQDLGVGDSVDGFVVERISGGNVVVRKGAQRWILTVPDIPFSIGRE